MARGLLLVALLCLAGAAVVVFDIIPPVPSPHIPSTLLTFISLVTFDVLATAVISWRIYKVIREAGGLQRLSRHSMAGLIMRSGAIYFNVMTGIQVGSIVLYAEPEGVYSQALNNYTLLISSILTSRFLLDLRSAALDRTPDISTSQDCFSTNMHSIKFAYRRSRSNNSVEKSRWRWLTVVEDFEDPEMCDSDYMGDKGSELRELEQVRVSTENSDVRTGRDEEETSR
ncbi:hypothetical protein GLOTRDRAFT_130977 [Gloeophyllum trabeum ATCC 11539]|uniref:Uncharacterized protein n=1 Tax=Gloeophyllum trabeum (strain ATCC 11539 / FP-39264 / Madison 617) TaxID=670483 RepID=S7RH99_GLOTA|nr:uncharacterized protein GLOTRDRAFT_130977 [Gloeophyllum trabeum ATCC 11539]EPQ53640.1 hypothetical protein GLOTRDRAFT_130977 [Gloeophyllum trabeum ATCC 11539]